ncbi:MAG: prepilin-type N-terminal cleavage/methylation domain-containing protein [Dehalococcoidia bacterium]|nr:MAG: prepilin-type N-terminal cleavage/methylation domain-containing protein [Dehalococcoidia bacterium]
MKLSERGFTLVELLVVIAIMSLITLGATMTTFQIINVTRQSNDHVAAVRQVQNAGYWVSRDAQMAENVVVDDDPETAEFLILTWTEWGYDEDSYYHEATYSFQDLSGGIGKLERQYVVYDDDLDELESKTNLIAEYIYYNLTDPDDTTKADYENPPVLTVQITASLGEASETKEYQVEHRPDF